MKKNVIEGIKRSVTHVSLPAIVLILAGSCVTSQEQNDLTNVNKEWDKTIRASHIYPIYPLTEDLQPGDIFLVSKQINDNSVWNQPGYLKLDRLIARIPITNYAGFYANAFDYAGQKLPKNFIDTVTWTNAPGAAFPSYGFAIQQGGGANVSLPIQGIPVGLALMGAKSASGQVTIAEAHTYGIDELSLRPLVNAFVHEHGEALEKLLEAETTKTNYLQIVTRVFATKRVAVSMYKDSGYAVTASGGMPKDVPIPTMATTNAAENYSNLVTAVNGIVASNQQVFAAASALVPGGTLKFTSVSSSSVSLVEQFDRPLVIGYLGFNLEVDPDSLALAKTNRTKTLRSAKHAEALLFQQSK